MTCQPRGTRQQAFEQAIKPAVSHYARAARIALYTLPHGCPFLCSPHLPYPMVVLSCAPHTCPSLAPCGPKGMGIADSYDSHSMTARITQVTMAGVWAVSAGMACKRLSVGRSGHGS